MSRKQHKPPESPLVRCAIYTRKSTDEGLEQEFSSLDAQRESAEAYIASQKAEGWVCLDEHYDDGGFSGGNMDRPARARLLADISAGNVDCVVVYKVDRLSRSLLDFARIMGVFDQQKVAFVSVTQQFNTSAPMGRLVLNVLLSFAQFEREIIGERIRDKIAAQRRKGKWTGGYPILGYDVDRSGGSPKLVVNNGEAHRVREIFTMYLSRGSLLPVVEELERRGWNNKLWYTKKGTLKGGGVFDRGALYALLTNPLYVGRIKHKSDVYDGEQEAIVTAELYQKVQDQLHYNGRTGGTDARNKYGALLRGLLVCQSCGHTMVHNFAGRKGKRYRYYTCTRAIKQGRKKCPSGSVPAVEIEQFVLEQIRCIANDPDLRKAVLQEARKEYEENLHDLIAERRRTEKELEQRHGEILNLAVDRAVSSLTTARIADAHEQLGRLETRLAELRNEIVERKREQLQAEDIDAAFADFDNVWRALTPYEQAKLVALIVARVEFDAEENTVEVSFHPSAIKTLADRQREEAA